MTKNENLPILKNASESLRVLQENPTLQNTAKLNKKLIKLAAAEEYSTLASTAQRATEALEGRNRLQPTPFNTIHNICVSSMNEGNYNEVGEIATEIVENTPANSFGRAMGVNLLIQTSQHFMEQGNFDKAFELSIKAYHRSNKACPLAQQSLNQTAEIAQSTPEVKKALGMLRQTARVLPQTDFYERVEKINKAAPQLAEIDEIAGAKAPTLIAELISGFCEDIQAYGKKHIGMGTQTA